MNSWNFTGNLGADAETRYTQDGKAIASFSVGVKSGYGDKASTTWARCSLFGKQAESVAQYLLKGSQVGIVGEVNNREYQDKEGQKRYSLDVRVVDLTLLGGRPEGQQKPSQHQQAKQDGYAPDERADRPKPSFDDLGDDLPF